MTVSDKGFTLLEILLVMAIMAMASLVLVPNLTGLEARSFSAQVREAQSLLNYARRIAVVSGQPSVASFYFDTPDPDAVTSPNTRNRVGQWHSDGTAITYRDSTDRDVEVEEIIDITFYPEGGSTGGSLMLQNDDRIVTIHIDPFTGRIDTREDDE